jgi:hypothetical protein
MPSIQWVVFKPPGVPHACLVPSTAFDLKNVERQRWKHGDVVDAEFHKHRSGPNHRRLFGLLRFVYEAQERFADVEALRCFLTLQTSFVTSCEDPKLGISLRFPMSWSYESMDETQFAELRHQVQDVIVREFFPHADENWLKASVNTQGFMDGVMSFF